MVVHSCTRLGQVGTTWSQSVRDREFLVKMKLKNLEPGDLENEAENKDALEDGSGTESEEEDEM